LVQAHGRLVRPVLRWIASIIATERIDEWLRRLRTVIIRMLKHLGHSRILLEGLRLSLFVVRFMPPAFITLVIAPFTMLLPSRVRLALAL